MNLEDYVHLALDNRAGDYDSAYPMTLADAEQHALDALEDWLEDFYCFEQDEVTLEGEALLAAEEWWDSEQDR